MQKKEEAESYILLFLIFPHFCLQINVLKFVITSGEKIGKHRLS